MDSPSYLESGRRSARSGAREMWGKYDGEPPSHPGRESPAVLALREYNLVDRKSDGNGVPDMYEGDFGRLAIRVGSGWSVDETMAIIEDDGTITEFRAKLLSVGDAEFVSADAVDGLMNGAAACDECDTSHCRTVKSLMSTLTFTLGLPATW